MQVLQLSGLCYAAAGPAAHMTAALSTMTEVDAHTSCS